MLVPVKLSAVHLFTWHNRLERIWITTAKTEAAKTDEHKIYITARSFGHDCSATVIRTSAQPRPHVGVVVKHQGPSVMRNRQSGSTTASPHFNPPPSLLCQPLFPLFQPQKLTDLKTVCCVWRRARTNLLITSRMSSALRPVHAVTDESPASVQCRRGGGAR